MDPIKIRLTYYESSLMLAYVENAAKMAKHPQAREELYVLSEFFPSMVKQCYRYCTRKRTNPYLYTIPFSVARILHRRWQLEKIPQELQIVLSGLDKILTNLAMKPDPMKPTLS